MYIVYTKETKKKKKKNDNNNKQILVVHNYEKKLTCPRSLSMQTIKYIVVPYIIIIIMILELAIWRAGKEDDRRGRKKTFG